MEKVQETRQVMALKDDIAKIDAKVDKLDDRLDSIDVHIAEYNEQLKYHIRRTDILEDEHKGVIKHISMVRGALTLLASSGIILAIAKLIDYIRG